MKAANTAWANFVRVRDASARIGAKEGVATPAQMLSAVRSQDKSAGKSAFSKGDALLQDLAEPAKNVLPTTIPDSGTAGRTLMALLGYGAGTAAIGPGLIAGGVAGALPYTKLGGKLTLAALAKRPEFAGTIADVLKLGAPEAGIASGLMAPSLTRP